MSMNVERRHLSVGQRAMAWAKVYPDPAKLRRKGSGLSETERQVSNTRLSMARTVLPHDDLADAVLAGEVSLDQAYETALARKNSAMSQEDINRLVAEAKMERVDGIEPPA